MTDVRFDDGQFVVYHDGKACAAAPTREEAELVAQSYREAKARRRPVTGGSTASAAAPCELCGGTQVVEIIPHGGGANDAREDECPWCLRDQFTPGWR